MKGLVAKIALDGVTIAFDKLYSYVISPDVYKKALKGSRVLVPFGRGNIKKQGIIFDIAEEDVKGLKNIFSVIDDTPVLTEELTEMCRYMQENLFCTFYDAVRIMLPAGINYKIIYLYTANINFCSVSLLNNDEAKAYNFLLKSGETKEETIINRCMVSAEVLNSLLKKEAILKTSGAKRKLNDSTEKWAQTSVTSDEAESYKLTSRQKEIFTLISNAENVSVREIRYFTGASLSVINNLYEKGLITLYDKQVFRTPYKNLQTSERENITLTDEQEKAFRGMLSIYKEKKGAVSLLYGITGSGKTQVFLKLVDEVSDAGQGVIVMVPEIALTPQIINIFSRRYGNKISVFHSAMSLGQRMDEWKRIKNGEALIAIGTRSAVFAPFNNLGLIIIDEEQENTYKSEKSPRYHARELAKFRTAYNKGLLCLASATPSVESYTAAITGKYYLFKLQNRYGNAYLPEVETVDMKKEILSGNSSSISRQLFENIRETLDNKKQAIILLNRRGHNTYISCPDCGYTVTCPNCSISMTYHSANKRLMCHYCGYSIKADNKCPQCGHENMKYMGIGTQKVEEELKLLFKDARVLRVDADSTMTRESYTKYLDEFSKGNYDILLGTQMVAKGLNFPNVTLVGVIGADQAMYSDDFRSFERTFSLLTQVVGRAGRGDVPGKAIIQTVNPENNIIELAAKQDYDSFYNDEINTRKLMIYPPYCDICLVMTQSSNQNIASETIKSIFCKIKEIIKRNENEIKLIILGPTPATVPKVSNKYRYRMIIKCRNNKKFRDLLRESITVKMNQDVSVMVDINPETII